MKECMLFKPVGMIGLTLNVDVLNCLNGLNYLNGGSAYANR